MDESGRFEDRSNEVRFVGGLAKVTDDYDKERDNLLKCMQDACDGFNQELKKNRKAWCVIYPVSLHGMEKSSLRTCGNGTIPASSVVASRDYKDWNKKFKKYIETALVEYLQKNGYKLFCTVDAGHGKDYGVDNTNASNLLKLDVGANFYKEIAGETLCNEIFYDIDSCYDTYFLELATRTVSVNGADDLEEYNSDFGINKGTGKPNRVYITNRSYYNAFITAKMRDSLEKYDTFSKCEFRLNVRPINYDNCNNATEQAFLYAADIVCGYIRNFLKDKRGNGKYTSELFLEAAKENKISLHIYNKLMLMYQDMYEHIGEMRLDQYYSMRYEIEQMKDDVYYADFYRKYWIAYLDKYLDDRLKDETVCKQLRGRIDEFTDFIQSFIRVDHPNYEKGLFIAEKLLRIVERLGVYNQKGKNLFELYDIILGCYNHRGSVKDTAAYVQKCAAYKYHVPMERYFEHTLKVMQFYCNAFQYEEAHKACKDQVEVLLQLKKVYSDAYMVGVNTVKGIVDIKDAEQLPANALWGKFLSSVGQVFGFRHEFERGYKYFDVALSEYSDGYPETNSSNDKGRHGGNYGITMCHYLHLAIEANDQAKYEELSKIYYGTEQLDEQLDVVMPKDDKIKPFGLFVYVKAFRVFYSDEEHREIFRSLLKRLAGLKEIPDPAHPWELIYKNIWESLRKFDNQTGFNKSFIENNTIDLLPKEEVDDTIKIIQLGFRLNYGEHYEPTSVEKGICTRLGLMKDGDTVDALRSKLNEILTYEYC